MPAIQNPKIHRKSSFAKDNPQTFQIEIIKAALKERDEEKEDNTVKAINKLSEIILQSMKNNRNNTNQEQN